ncbi:hypothetical protein [Lapillicoccus jejuensis]|uniref:hypothetical protein n=1 Tax=Lapillicoccus jejuensis TaxID=402171 RepID=UPI001152820B|nr:hypothetical protein [Lapillicoccus jejuensis]
MCDDHDDCPDLDLHALGLSGALSTGRAVGHPFTRRQVLRWGSAAAAVAWFAARSAPPARALSAGPAAVGGLVLTDGTRSRRHAMHVHSSASEGPGSFANQIALADANGCDVIWPTEHDWRMFAVPGDDRIARGYAFTSLKSAGWTWKPTASGAATASRAQVTPYQGGSALALGVTAGGNATTGLKATTRTHLFEGSVIGRSLLAPATVTALSGQAWFEVVLTLSNQGSRVLHLVYRYGTTPASRRLVNATTAHVFVPVRVGDTIADPVDIEADVASFFGSVCDPQDNSVVGITVQANTAGGRVEVMLPRLDLPRDVTGQAAFDAVCAMYDRVAAGRTAVWRKGIEVSGTDKHHLGWYGDDATNLPFSETTTSLEAAVAQIRARGSIASFNHPYGVATSTGVRDPAKILKAYTQIRPSGVYGADVIELGYDSRGGMTTDDHLALGDLLWCDGVVITANGVSDDHNGNTWKNTYLTQPWSTGTPAADLAALRTGRATVTRTGYAGDLWAELDGRPMGSVPSRTQNAPGTLTVRASGVPASWTLEVVRGAVVPLGRRRTAADLTVTRLPGSALASGSTDVGVAGGNGYVRVLLRDGAGVVQQFGNPVWSGVPSTAGIDPGRVVAV